MIRTLILFFIFKSILFGCTICTVYSPKTHFDVEVNTDKNIIKDAKIKWNLDPDFTAELLRLYDRNLNTKLDEKELLMVEDALLSYIEQKNYLTFISYDEEINEVGIEVNPKNKLLAFSNNSLSFEYEFDLNLEIIDDYKLYIEVYDEAGYFIMIANHEKQLINSPYQTTKILDHNSAIFTINKDNSSVVINEVKKDSLVEKIINEENVETTKKEPTLLETFVSKVKYYLLEIEKGEDKFALVFLLFVSFVYGVIHALGPGHGKALAFSYFSSQKSSYVQAFGISFATAFIHIVGALILVVISIFILETLFSSFLDDSIKYITQISALLIMLLSIFIFYKKVKKQSCGCNVCATSNTPTFTTVGKVDFVKQTSSNKIVVDNSRKKEDLFFVLTAGLIPCPGTVVLFVYAFVLKTYFSVILASIAISLGMGLVIFASSFLGVSLNKVANKSHRLINIVEIVSPIIMFLLGLFLLLNANILS